MTTLSMPTTLSTLELMLEKIRQLENEPKGWLPPLPVRPVSKGRLLPRARRRFVELVNSDVNKPDEELIQIDRMDDTRERKVEGALVMQRCFRGYRARCDYNEHKRRVILLQSFIRGENARKNYQRIVKDYVRVPQTFLANLQRQVLRTEAAIRNTKTENSVLENHIQQYEKRWIENEIRMKSMEKMWQDELTVMQINLAEAKKDRPIKLSSDRSLAKLFELSREEVEQELNSGKNQNELNILENKFKAWKKEYKIRLEEAKVMMKKSGKTWRVAVKVR